jgi:hypothetical protein
MNRPYKSFDLLDSSLGMLLSRELNGEESVFFTEAGYNRIFY